MPSNRILHLSNSRKQLQADQLQMANRAVADSRSMLKNNPRPDTFAGRKTQEPFPQEQEEIIRRINSRETQPPE